MKCFGFAIIFSAIVLELVFAFSGVVRALTFDFEDKAQLKEFEQVLGAVEIENGELVLSIPTGAEGIVILKNWDNAWTTYTIEVKGKVVDTGAGGGTGGFGIISRYLNADNQFIGPYLEMSVMQDNVQIKKDGKWGARLNPTEFKIEFDRWYQFKIVVASNTYEAYIDGAKHYKMTDDSIQSGSPGFYVWKHKAVFDNLVITGSGIPTAVDSARKLAATWGAIKKQY
jgi:hypothetical protein